MLYIETGEHADPSGSQRTRVLPAFRVLRIAEIRVRQFVEDHNFRLRSKRCVEIEFCESHPSDFDHARRNRRYAFAEFVELRPAFRFDPSDDDARPRVDARPSFGEKAVRFPTARGRGEEDG